MKFTRAGIFSLLLAASLICSFTTSPAGSVTAGPMLGYAEHREAQIWLELSADTRVAEVIYFPLSDKKNKKKKLLHITSNNSPIPVKFTLPLLEMNTLYGYVIILDGIIQEFPFPCEFKTKILWEHRSAPPDFSFLFGSCLYLNDSLYDRPGIPYGKSTEILKSMYQTSSDFIVWGGDNVYLREADYSSVSGMRYRYSKNFSHPLLGRLRASRCNFAIWDDHDFGPNDSGKEFRLRDSSLQIFREYWCASAFGGPKGGIYQSFKWADAEFFLLDDRYFRTPPEAKSAGEKKGEFLGDEQLEWLENSLTNSDASLKFIVCGSQVLNPLNSKECMRNYQYEYNRLMKHIAASKSEGIIFLSGDRHFSEILKDTSIAAYPVYDITCSPITSGVFHPEKTKEANNPLRIAGSLYASQNFSLISVTGSGKERILKIEWKNISGESVYVHEIPLTSLRASQSRK